jgi:hypothetical protein
MFVSALRRRVHKPSLWLRPRLNRAGSRRGD